MVLIHRTKKEKVVFDIRKDYVLVILSNKRDDIMVSVSVDREGFDEDVADVLQFCSNKITKRWIKRNINYNIVEQWRNKI